jgi:protein SCO1/2
MSIPKRTSSYFLGLLTIVALCNAGSQTVSALPIPEFRLTNLDGRTVTNDSLRGRPTILVFTYAKCDFACPMVTFMLKSLDEELSSPTNLNFAHITVNPILDTPEELLKHFKDHEIDPIKDPRWLFLTGSESETDSVLSDFNVDVTRTRVEGGVRIEHTTLVIVMNPEGEVTATFDTYLWDGKEMRDAIGPLSNGP